jgi:hypothetical protein
MQGFDESNTPSVPDVPSSPNAFSPSILRRLGERDEPPTAGEADVVGPWRIERIPGEGFVLFRTGESLARRFVPAAIFPDRWLARIAAAFLPGTGRDPILHLAKEADADGFYAITLDNGEVVGRFQLFDQDLLEHMNAGIHLLGSPESLAYFIEAAGAVTLERCGAILDERVPEGEAGAE